MGNHFHLLVETPEANLSSAMQWVNVSYSVWLNRGHDRAGHLLQGRFKSVIVRDDTGWQELGRYIHLTKGKSEPNSASDTVTGAVTRRCG